MVNIKANRDFRPILIPNKAYDALKEAKELVIEQTRGNKDLSMAISAMGTGAFAGWIICKFLEDMK